MYGSIWLKAMYGSGSANFINDSKFKTPILGQSSRAALGTTAVAEALDAPNHIPMLGEALM